MRTYVNHYVQSCEICQRTKSACHRPYGLLEPLPIADKPWSSVSIDFIVKLPESNGFDSILVVVCRCTKMAHFIPCLETITAPELAQLYFENIFKLHGLPETLISDRGPQFKSHFWKAFWTLLGTKPTLSSSYHAETDGQTERVNQCVEQYLRCFVNY